MIVPQSRLLWWTGLVGVPLVGAAPLIPQALPLFALLGLGAFGMLAWDARRGLRRLRGLSLALPAVVRVFRARPAHLPVTITSETPQVDTVRVGLALPSGLETPHDVVSVAYSDPITTGRLDWPFTARERGRFAVALAALEVTSPWRFWACRRRLPLATEIRVYPNLFAERRRVAARFLTRGAGGAHLQRQVGKGREFEQLREYLPGDSFDDVHWKATAKRQRPVTKVFQVERTQEVYVVLDASRLAGRPVAAVDGGDAEPVLERYLNSTLLLGQAAERQGDLFGLVVFADQVHRFVRARRGRGHYRACQEALSTLEPRRVTPDFEELATFLRLRLRRRALLLVLTSLDDPVLAEQFVRAIDVVRRQHLVLVQMAVPRGFGPLFGETPITAVDQVYERLAAHCRWQGMRELQVNLQRRGVELCLTPDDRLSAELIARYLGVKQRQLL